MNRPDPPSILAVAGELLSPLEFSRLVVAFPSLAVQAKGAGETVIVLPGLGASNTSTALMRAYLAWLGYDARGWTLGQNQGNVQELLPEVTTQVLDCRAERGDKVHLVGWSLGGVVAREVARDHPEAVRQVITMGSPLVGGPKYTSLARLYAQRGADLDAVEARIAAREARPIEVPTTSIYSKRDGIVGWQASIDRHTAGAEHIEVSATHFSLGISPEVLKILARKLATG